MKIVNTTTMLSGLLLCSLGISSCGASDTAPDKGVSATAETTPLTETYIWFDGQHKRTVYLNPRLIAEFGIVDKPSAVKKIYPQAQEIPRKGGIRLWQVDDALTAMTKLKTAGPSAKYSPVLHDGPSSGTRMRALPSGIIVYLNPQWDQAAVESWAAANRLEIEKKLEIGPNVYVVKTAPGLEALELANSLVQAGQVVSAVPNWWQEVATR